MTFWQIGRNVKFQIKITELPRVFLNLYAQMHRLTKPYISIARNRNRKKMELNFWQRERLAYQLIHKKGILASIQFNSFEWSIASDKPINPLLHYTFKAERVMRLYRSKYNLDVKEPALKYQQNTFHFPYMWTGIVERDRLCFVGHKLNASQRNQFSLSLSLSLAFSPYFFFVCDSIECSQIPLVFQASVPLSSARWMNLFFHLESTRVKSRPIHASFCCKLQSFHSIYQSTPIQFRTIFFVKNLFVKIISEALLWLLEKSIKLPIPSFAIAVSHSMY